MVSLHSFFSFALRSGGRSTVEWCKGSGESRARVSLMVAYMERSE